MVSPSRRRDAVRYLVRRRQGVGASGVPAGRAAPLDAAVRAGAAGATSCGWSARMNELAAAHPRYGYRRVWALLRGEGWRVNRKRIERLWRLEGHRVPPRRNRARARRQAGRGARDLEPAGVRPNHVWSYDFMGARTGDGSPIRILNVVDEYTRVALGSRVARSIGARDVIVELERLFAQHGKPQVLRSDNGREFIAATLGDWLAEQGVKTAFIEKGSPQQNAYVERFNGTMRDEVLNGEEFDSRARGPRRDRRLARRVQHRAARTAASA